MKVIENSTEMYDDMQVIKRPCYRMILYKSKFSLIMITYSNQKKMTENTNGKHYINVSSSKLLTMS